MEPAEINDELLAQFIALTSADEQQARFMLEAANGSIDAAARMYFEHFPAISPVAPAAHPAAPGATPPRPRAPGAPRPPAPPRLSLLGTMLRLPVAIVTTSIGATATMLQLGLGVAAFLGDRLLPRAVMRAVRSLATALAASPNATPPAEQAARFIAEFKDAYGDTHPRWVPLSWRDAVADAHSQSKFLFVYLHAPRHQDTPAFCRSLLCNPELVAYVNEHYVSWGGNITRPDAFILSGRLGVTTYPAVALLAFSGARTKLVAAVQGAGLGVRQLLAALQRAEEAQGAALVAERIERAERESSRRLLDEQNAEYEAALAADRQREAEREAARRLAEQEARQREEEAARARAEVEAAEQRRADAVASVARRREAARSALPSEPPPGVPTAAIRVRLPNGSNHQRRFDPQQHTVQTLYDFVNSLDGCDFFKYNLASAFPRRTYGPDCLGLSLEECGLSPQAALFVQPEDDE